MREAVIIRASWNFDPPRKPRPQKRTSRRRPGCRRDKGSIKPRPRRSSSNSIRCRHTSSDATTPVATSSPSPRRCQPRHHAMPRMPGEPAIKTALRASSSDDQRPVARLNAQVGTPSRGDRTLAAPLVGFGSSRRWAFFLALGLVAALLTRRELFDAIVPLLRKFFNVDSTAANFFCSALSVRPALSARCVIGKADKSLR